MSASHGSVADMQRETHRQTQANTYLAPMSPRPAPRFLDRLTPSTLLTLILMASLPPMAMSIFLPALPQISTYFDAPYHQAQLAVAIYLGGNAVLQLLIGPIADRYGRRPIMLGSICVFLLATLLATTAKTIETFLLARILQSSIVAGVALSRAIVRDTTAPEAAASRVAYVTMGMSISPMLAPILGGYLTSLFGWQSSFVVLLFAGIGLFIICFLDVGETSPGTDQSLWATFRGYPELLTSQRFMGYALCTLFASGAFFLYLGGAPLIGQTYYGLSETTLGLAMAAPALGYFFGNFGAGKYSTRMGINRMILIGSLVVLLGLICALAGVIWGAKSPYVFFGAMVILGFGNGLQMPNSIAGTLGVRPNLAGTASGLGGAMMIGGGAAFSALAGRLLHPGDTPQILLLLMIAASACCLLAVLWVMRRQRQLGIR